MYVIELNLQLPFSWIHRIWKFLGFREREREGTVNPVFEDFT
jgi:hypothetical protein